MMRSAGRGRPRRGRTAKDGPFVSGRYDRRRLDFTEDASMTFQSCQSALVAIRREQGTRCPLLRVDFGGWVFKGRLKRADSDPEYRRENHSPYGLIVLEDLGLVRGPETLLQIADIPDDGIKS